MKNLFFAFILLFASCDKEESSVTVFVNPQTATVYFFDGLHLKGNHYQYEGEGIMKNTLTGTVLLFTEKQYVNNGKACFQCYQRTYTVAVDIKGNQIFQTGAVSGILPQTSVLYFDF